MENKELRISKSKLIKQVAIRYILILLIISSLLFLSAGSIKFWNAWIYICTFFLVYLFFLIYLVIKDPDLLQKRLKIKESEKSQKIFNILYYLASIITFLVSGLDFRYRWSDVPLWLVIVSTCIMVAGYIMSLIVMKQNSYASRVIEIQKGQRLIDTGLYSIVRHPMYLSALLIFCPIPLILGSFYTFILLVIFAPSLLILRIVNEERVLKDDLEGYKKYMEKVKYRLIPFIW